MTDDAPSPGRRARARTAIATTLAALAAILPSAAFSQAPTLRTVCTNHGPNVVEPIPDREGQSLLAAEATCVIQGGPMDGAVESQSNLWHYDKGSGTLLAGHAVARRPGQIAAAMTTSGTLTFQMTEGRVTGWSATGKGRYLLGTAAAASLAGRSFSWTATPTGPRSYVVAVTLDP